MFETIVVTSGGNMEGKTTFVMNSAVLLAQNEYEVTVIDFDPSMVSLNNIAQIEDIPLTLNNFFSGEVEIDDVIYSGLARVKVIPAGMKLKDLRNKEGVKALFERIIDESDILIFDVPGGFDEEIVIALSACNSQILVLQPRVASIKNALAVKMAGDKLNTEMMGVVVNKYSENSEVEVEDIEALFGEILALVPEDPAVKKALSYNRPVVVASPMGESSSALKEAVERIVEKLSNFDERAMEKRDLISRKRLLNTLVKRA